MVVLLTIIIVIAVFVATGLVVAGFLPADPENYKRCRHCRKTVKIEDVVCKFCRKDLVELPYD